MLLRLSSSDPKEVKIYHHTATVITSLDLIDKKASDQKRRQRGVQQQPPPRPNRPTGSHADLSGRQMPTAAHPSCRPASEVCWAYRGDLAVPGQTCARYAKRALLLPHHTPPFLSASPTVPPSRHPPHSLHSLWASSHRDLRLAGPARPARHDPEADSLGIAMHTSNLQLVSP